MAPASKTKLPRIEKIVKQFCLWLDEPEQECANPTARPEKPQSPHSQN